MKYRQVDVQERIFSALQANEASFWIPYQSKGAPIYILTLYYRWWNEP